jgi:hypothetical protein
MLLGAAKLRFLDEKSKVDQTEDVMFATPFCDGPQSIDWHQAAPVEASLDELEKEPAEAAQFEELPHDAANAKNYPGWSKAFANWLFQTQTVTLFESPSLGDQSKPGEAERDFRIRLQQAAREERDRIAAALRQKYAPRMAMLDERKRRAELATEQQKAQQKQAVMQSAVSMGMGVLSAFLGRKMISATNVNRAASAARQVGRTWKESHDVALATENVQQIDQQVAELQHQFEADLTEQQAKVDPATEVFETVTVRLKKTNINVQLVALTWMPRESA